MSVGDKVVIAPSKAGTARWQRFKGVVGVITQVLPNATYRVRFNGTSFNCAGDWLARAS